MPMLDIYVHVTHAYMASHVTGRCTFLIRRQAYVVPVDTEVRFKCRKSMR